MTARRGDGVALGLDAAARQHGAGDFAARRPRTCRASGRRARQGQAARRGVGRAAARARRGRSSSRAILSAFYSHPWAWNEIGFGGPAYPRGYARLGRGAARELGGGAGVRARSREGHRAARGAGNVSRRHELRTLRARRASPARERLRIPARRPPARGPARADGALRRLVLGRPGDRRSRRRRRHAGPAAGAARMEGRGAGVGAVLGSGRGLGLRRGRLAPALLDRRAGHRRV